MTSTGSRSDQYCSRRRPVLVAIGHQYCFTQRPVLVTIAEEGLQEQPAKRYIQQSLSRGYASEYGTDLRSVLPKMSPLNPAYREKRQRVLRRIRDFVAKYKGIGSDL